jgi:hypothetical protein
VFPWLLAIALAGWAFIVSTGRTEQARAVFDAVVANVTGLIGTGRRLTETSVPTREPPTARPDPETAPAERRDGTPPAAESMPSLTVPPPVTLPLPDVPPMVVDTTRPPLPGDSAR